MYTPYCDNLPLQDADKSSLKCLLEAALLTAHEFNSGCGAWERFANPFLALDGDGSGSSSSSSTAESAAMGKL